MLNRFHFILMILIVNSNAYAETFQTVLKDPLKVDELFVEYRKVSNLRDPYYTKEENDKWSNVSEFHWKVSALRRLYWENNFHFRMDDTQVRHVGWEYRVGLSIFKYVDIVKYHHSQHCTECKPEARFPVEDSYGVRIYFKK